MNTGDEELKQLFAAQREVDRSLAPSFDVAQTAPEVRHARRPPRTRRWGALALVAAAALTGAIIWFSLPRSEKPAGRPTSPTDLEKFNAACDSLLRTINDTTETPEPAAFNEPMQWPTGTDFLLSTDDNHPDLE